MGGSRLLRFRLGTEPVRQAFDLDHVRCRETETFDIWHQGPEEITIVPQRAFWSCDCILDGFDARPRQPGIMEHLPDVGAHDVAWPWHPHRGHCGLRGGHAGDRRDEAKPDPSFGLVAAHRAACARFDQINIDDDAVFEGAARATDTALDELLKTPPTKRAGARSAIEIDRDAASGPDRDFLDRRLEASRLLLEWLSKALEPDPAASPTAQTPPPSASQADPDQSPPPESATRVRAMESVGGSCAAPRPRHRGLAGPRNGRRPVTAPSTSTRACSLRPFTFLPAS
jgi:hypothetical protein